MVLWCSARWWYKVNVERLSAACGFCVCVQRNLAALSLSPSLQSSSHFSLSLPLSHIWCVQHTHSRVRMEMDRSMFLKFNFVSVISPLSSSFLSIPTPPLLLLLLLFPPCLHFLTFPSITSFPLHCELCGGSVPVIRLIVRASKRYL